METDADIHPQNLNKTLSVSHKIKSLVLHGARKRRLLGNPAIIKNNPSKARSS